MTELLLGHNALNTEEKTNPVKQRPFLLVTLERLEKPRGTRRHANHNRLWTANNKHPPSLRTPKGRAAIQTCCVLINKHAPVWIATRLVAARDDGWC